MQLSPARGRLLNQAGLGILKNAMQLSAARGRLPRVDRKVTFDAGCSLAPRGDGYANIGFDRAELLMQLIPARGRLRLCTALDSDLADAAYPREGTAT